jgi:hypothetical protein
MQKPFRTQKFEVLIGAAKVLGETFEIIMAEVLKSTKLRYQILIRDLMKRYFLTVFRNLVIEPLNRTHDRTGFQCGVEALAGSRKRLPAG